MKKNRLIIAILSLIISISITYNSLELHTFAIATVILALFSYVIISLAYKLVLESIESMRQRKIIKAVFGAFLLSVLIIAVLSILFMLKFGGWTTWPSPHLRTNILTGRCDYGVDSQGDPWYYRDGCESSEDAIEALQKAGQYNSELAICKMRCDPLVEESYCNGLCKHLMQCEYIDCS